MLLRISEDLIVEIMGIIECGEQDMAYGYSKVLKPGCLLRH
jgi:hypothetical protein